jgi:hypothetical protein
VVRIYTGSIDDPRMNAASDGAYWFWTCLVSMCNKTGRDVLQWDEVAGAHGQRNVNEISPLLDELEAVELVERLPELHVRMLALHDLWDFDEPA